jgi:hypothetical protein
MLSVPYLCHLPERFGAGHQVARRVHAWVRSRPGGQSGSEEEGVLEPSVLEPEEVWFGDVCGECDEQWDVVRRRADARSKHTGWEQGTELGVKESTIKSSECGFLAIVVQVNWRSRRGSSRSARELM